MDLTGKPNKFRLINTNKIKTTIPGLDMYKDNIDEKMIMEYKEATESHNSSFYKPWSLVAAIVLFTMNVIGLLAKNNSVPEYKMMKIAETLATMRAYNYPKG